jgi:hypothetical protein
LQESRDAKTGDRKEKEQESVVTRRTQQGFDAIAIALLKNKGALV